MNRSLRQTGNSLRLAAVLAISLTPAFASQFTTPGDVCRNTNCSTFGANYTGLNAGGGILDLRGAVSDGGQDAFDSYGYITNLGALTLNRRVDALTALNTYRFLDTYTNTTNAPISEFVIFAGNLTHNGNHTLLANTPYLVVDQDNTGRIPTAALLNGNNDWALNNMSTSYKGREYNLAIHLTLAPGQSVSILHFAFLTFDTGKPRDLAGDDALALGLGQDLMWNPNYDGLSASEIKGIVNFNPAPEPTTVGLVGLGLAGAIAFRRRSARR